MLSMHWRRFDTWNEDHPRDFVDIKEMSRV